MSGQLAKWLLCNSVAIDEIGRILIRDQDILSEINGAVNELTSELVGGGNRLCGAGCDTGCTGCES